MRCFQRQLYSSAPVVLWSSSGHVSSFSLCFLFHHVQMFHLDLEIKQKLLSQSGGPPAARLQTHTHTLYLGPTWRTAKFFFLFLNELSSLLASKKSSPAVFCTYCSSSPATQEAYFPGIISSLGQIRPLQLFSFGLVEELIYKQDHPVAALCSETGWGSENIEKALQMISNFY